MFASHASSVIRGRLTSIKIQNSDIFFTIPANEDVRGTKYVIQSMRGTKYNGVDKMEREGRNKGVDEMEQSERGEIQGDK